MKTCIWIVAAALLPLGCGGDGVPSAQGMSPDVPRAWEGAPLKANQRHAAIDAAALKFKALVDAHDSKPFESLALWMRGQKSLWSYAAGSEGSRTVSARFVDGRKFLFLDNFAFNQERASQPFPASLVREDEILKGKTGVVFSGQREEFIGQGDSFLKAIGYLKEAGYSVAGIKPLTLASLKAFGKPSFAIVHAHGGVWTGAGTEYMISSEEKVTDATEALYAADLDAGNLAYTCNGLLARLGLSSRGRYLVGSGWVRKYWSFGEGAMAILYACNSGSASAAAFREAVFGKAGGKATIIGWNGPASNLAAPAIVRLVDRMTAANREEPQTYGNRAFDFTDTWAYLRRVGLTSDPNGTQLARFVRGEAPAFLPAIKRLTFQEGDEMILEGDFGNQEGTVTVGGAPVTLLSWGPSEISVRLPKKGAGSNGDVVVRVLGRDSEPRILMSYRPTMEYWIQTKSSTSNWKTALTFQPHIWADLYEVRNSVDQDVFHEKQAFGIASDSKLSWKSSGFAQGSDGTAIASGEGSTTQEESGMFSGDQNAKLHRLEFAVRVPAKARTIWTAPSGTTSSGIYFAPIKPIVDEVTVDNPLGVVYLKLTPPNHGAPDAAGQRKILASSRSKASGKSTFYLRWVFVEPETPFRDGLPR